MGAGGRWGKTRWSKYGKILITVDLGGWTYEISFLFVQVLQGADTKMGLKVFILLEEMPVRKRTEKGQTGWESCYSTRRSAPEWSREERLGRCIWHLGADMEPEDSCTKPQGSTWLKIASRGARMSQDAVALMYLPCWQGPALGRYSLCTTRSQELNPRSVTAPALRGLLSMLPWLPCKEFIKHLLLSTLYLEHFSMNTKRKKNGENRKF